MRITGIMIDNQDLVIYRGYQLEWQEEDIIGALAMEDGGKLEVKPATLVNVKGNKAVSELKVILIYDKNNSSGKVCYGDRAKCQVFAFGNLFIAKFEDEKIKNLSEEEQQFVLNHIELRFGSYRLNQTMEEIKNV